MLGQRPEGIRVGPGATNRHQGLMSSTDETFRRVQGPFSFTRGDFLSAVPGNLSYQGDFLMISSRNIQPSSVNNALHNTSNEPGQYAALYLGKIARSVQ